MVRTTFLHSLTINTVIKSTLKNIEKHVTQQQYLLILKTNSMWPDAKYPNHDSNKKCQVQSKLPSGLCKVN